MTEREMARKKAARKARARKAHARRVAMTVALMLVVCVASIGGTIAWLQDKTESVINTFSPSNIELDLEETDTVPDAEGNETKEFQLVPSVDITKDPKVTASSDVAYYVFVKVTEENWPTYVDTVDGVQTRKVNYAIDPYWTELTGVTLNTGEKVYYKALNANDEVNGQSILAGDKVTVSSTLTKAEMEAIKTAGNPKLSFKSYAIQQANGTTVFSAADAWDLVKNS